MILAQVIVEVIVEVIVDDADISHWRGDGQLNLKERRCRDRYLTPAVPEFTRVIWTPRRRCGLVSEATEVDGVGDLVVSSGSLCHSDRKAVLARCGSKYM